MVCDPKHQVHYLGVYDNHQPVSYEHHGYSKSLRAFRCLNFPCLYFVESFWFTMNSSLSNGNSVCRLSDQAGPSSIPHSVAHASPPEFSVHTDIRPKSVLAHHKLIDSVHLLNDEEEEEEEEDENIATNDDGKRTAGVDDETDGNVKAYNTVDQERTNESALTMETGTVKFRPSDLLDSDCPWGPLERGCPVEKTNGAKSLDPLENLIHQISPERILGIPTNTASISGSRQLRSVRDPSSSMESVSKSIETLRSEQSPKIIVPYMNSKSLDSNWFRVPDPEVGPDCSTRTEISSLNPPATSPNPIASYSMPSGLSAVRPVPLTRHSLSRPDFPASTDAVTPTPPEKDRRLAGNHLAGSASNYVDCVGGRRSRARSASRSSATYSRSNSEAPCTSCGMSYRVLRDHVVFLRTQLQAQYKATQAEARMRQLHSNAIEFLLKEVQELKTWKESVSQLLPDIQSPSNNTIGRVDKHQPIAPVPQIHASNDVIPSGPLVSRLQESITAQPIRPKKAISARGDSPLWSKLQATPRAVSTSSGPLDVCFDNTTQLFARIDPATSLRSTTGSQNEVVKVYASDEDELEESSNRAVQLADSPPPHLQPVISNPGRSRSETAPSSLQCTNSHVARYVNGFGFSSDSGCVHSTDEALDEIELVRQAAMQAINLSTSLSDGEVETPRQSESTIAANCDQTVVETTGEITVSSLTTNRTA
ncbi:putative thymidine kinase [Fasciola hepatica]|uniref:Thymidine kinase n=1 Tax=Fasciola hepatica TaxID=6192 RepID=A0A4E0R9J1_FASHE|nr:putative thymidine kinase [Fasciola hepatica]